MPNLNIQNLSKTYPNGTKALDNISLDIGPGLFGLLGPNGAGKSTLMRSIAALQEADAGRITFDGIDVQQEPEALRRRLGYLPQEFGVYPRITAAQLLDHLAVLKGIQGKKARKEWVEYLLQKVNLYEVRNKAVKGFSGGMKQRIGIAQALLGDPKLIIVDEPTAGLDPGERNRFHNLLAGVAEDVVVILSTHIVDDVRELCPRMAIMREGAMVYEGRPADALQKLEGQVWQCWVVREQLDEFRTRHTVISEKMVTGRLQAHVLSAQSPGPDFEPVAPNLEDVFFYYTTETATV